MASSSSSSTSNATIRVITIDHAVQSPPCLIIFLEIIFNKGLNKFIDVNI